MGSASGPCEEWGFTWYLHLQQGEQLEEEDGYPAESISEDDEEEPLCDGDFPGADTSLCCFGRSDVDGVEHAGVGKDDGDEGCEIQAWRGRNLALSIAKVQTSQAGIGGMAGGSRTTPAFITRGGRDISAAPASPESSLSPAMAVASSGVRLGTAAGWSRDPPQPGMGGRAGTPILQVPMGWQCPVKSDILLTEAVRAVMAPWRGWLGWAAPLPPGKPVLPHIIPVPRSQAPRWPYPGRWWQSSPGHWAARPGRTAAGSTPRSSRSSSQRSPYTTGGGC